MCWCGRSLRCGWSHCEWREGSGDHDKASAFSMKRFAVMASGAGMNEGNGHCDCHQSTVGLESFLWVAPHPGNDSGKDHSPPGCTIGRVHPFVRQMYGCHDNFRSGNVTRTHSNRLVLTRIGAILSLMAQKWRFTPSERCIEPLRRGQPCGVALGCRTSRQHNVHACGHGVLPQRANLSDLGDD